MSRRVALFLATWLLASATALAAPASFSVLFTNRGEALEDPSQGRFYIYEEGKRERYLTWGNAVRSARVEQGVYDIVIRYVNDTIVEERVLESFELTGDVVHEEAFEVSPAHLTIEITAGGAPIYIHSGSYDVHVSGRRGKPLASRRPGERVALRAGRYDIEARYRDPRGLQSTWLTDYLVIDDQVETVDIGVAAARVLVSLTYHGSPLPTGSGEWELHRPGDPQALTGGASGERLELPAGTYDLRAGYVPPGGFPLERWVRGITVEGDRSETVELEEAGNELVVIVRRAGEPLADAWYSVYPAGQTLTPIATERSGSAVELPTGDYDIHCTYRKGAIRAEQWLRAQTVDGPLELGVDLPLSTATLTIREPRRIRDRLDASNVLILLDSSLGMEDPMGSRSRLDLVSRTLLDTMGALDAEGTEVGLRVWGIAPRSLANCQDSTLMLPLAPYDSTAMGQALELMRPSGFSPIAFSLLESAADLPPDERSTVVVITGGADDCAGDACDAAARLIKRGRVDRIHIVGLDQPRHEESELACVGTYHSVSDRAQLRNSLRSIFREAQGADRGRVTVFLPGRNRWVASGELGQPIQLLEGRYDLLIRAGGRSWHWNDFQVRGDTRATAGPTP
jgi:hypothetical protein